MFAYVGALESEPSTSRKWPKYVLLNRSNFQSSTCSFISAITSSLGKSKAKIAEAATQTPPPHEPPPQCELNELECNILGLTWGVWDASVFDLSPKIILGADVLYETSEYTKQRNKWALSFGIFFLMFLSTCSGHHLREFLMVKWGLKCVRLLDGFSFMPSHKVFSLKWQPSVSRDCFEYSNG
ncbi:hypothetical protein UlMin_046204 [Ulmus minor]